MLNDTLPFQKFGACKTFILINTFIVQECLKLIKSDSKGIYSILSQNISICK